MSLAQFQRARLVPFAADGRDTEEARAIPLDFNPETLTLKVSGGEARDRARRGRQQVQNVGASKATLSFECHFDSTRPRDAQGDERGDEERLDVRLRTKPIADLLQVAGSGRERAPRRVQFRWGTLIFNGIVTAHQEVFDYFSPSGVPLRSKVQLTLTEQEFRYEVDASDAARQRDASAAAAADARSRATAAGADRLLGGAAPGMNLAAGMDLAAGFELATSLRLDGELAVELGVTASLGLAADLGVAAGAGIALDAGAAMDVFGPAALGASTDLGRSGLRFPPLSPGLAAAGVTPNPWAPDGPAPGSSAAALAAAVNAHRAAGAIPAPPAGNAAPASRAVAGVTPASAGPAQAPAPLPVHGSPPLALRRVPTPDGPLLAGGTLPRTLADGERRPSWETLPGAATPVDAPTGGQAGCGRARGCGGDGSCP